MAAKRTNKAAKPEEQVETPTSEEVKDQETGSEEVSEEQVETPGFVVAEVVEKFRDKESGSILGVGMSIAVTPARFDELDAAGVVKRCAD